MQRLSVALEVKSLGANKFEGYGSVFGNRDLGGDIVIPGAFRKSIAEHKAAGTMPLMFWMHQSDQVPGVWLDMGEDKNGLYMQGELVDTSLGRDVHTLLTKKAVRGLSIGYVPEDIGWSKDGERLLKQVSLHETSIVSMAMNPLARIESVKARLSALGEYVPTGAEIAQYFQSLGCSKHVARILAARMFDVQNSAHAEDSPPVAEPDDELKAAFDRLQQQMAIASTELKPLFI